MTPPVDEDGLGKSVCSGALDPEDVDELFAVMADRTRRCAVRSLVTAGGSQSFDDLVADVARETTVQPVDRDRKRDVATSLYHVHLPKLEAAGLVTEFDTDGVVRLCEPLEQRTHELIESL